MAKAPTRKKVKITAGNVSLYTLTLGADFVRQHKLHAKTKYPIKIEGLEDGDTEGSLQTNHIISGLAILYRNFKLKEGHEVEIFFEAGILHVLPDVSKISKTAVEKGEGLVRHRSKESVFQRQKLKYKHIPEFAPGNLQGWKPETETDVFLVFGKLSAYTDYKYCCGASKALLDALGYKAKKLIAKDGAKPDAILIDRATGEYLMAEFKVDSTDFVSNHHRDDVDVLICWEDDELDKAKLPARVLSLRKLREEGVKSGEIEINDLS